MSLSVSLCPCPRPCPLTGTGDMANELSLMNSDSSNYRSVRGGAPIPPHSRSCSATPGCFSLFSRAFPAPRNRRDRSVPARFSRQFLSYPGFGFFYLGMRLGNVERDQAGPEIPNQPRSSRFSSLPLSIVFFYFPITSSSRKSDFSHFLFSFNYRGP